MEVNRLKVTYQRNMLIGQLVAIVLAAIAVALISSLGSPGKFRPGFPDGATRAVPSGRSRLGPLSPAAFSIRHDKDTTRLPFFVRLRIIRDGGFSSIDGYRKFALVDPEKEYCRPDIDDLAFAQIGAVEVDTLFWAPGLPYGEEWFAGERTPPAFNQEAKLLMDVEPEYPPVARSEWIEGEVCVLVLVSKTGKLSPFPITTEEGERYVDTFLVLRETPSGWFFSDAVKKVLPQWRFLPRIENGDPVESYQKITYHFCLGASCTKLHVQAVSREHQ